VRNPLKIFVLVLVLGFWLAPLAAYSITTEEFMEKHPDAAIALSAVYYPNNVEDSIGTSGLRSNDPYSLDKRNVVPLGDVLRSGILSEEILHTLVVRADTSIDLVNSSITRGDTILDPRVYLDTFLRQEQIGISDEKGYLIISKLFGGYYDGFAASELEEMGPHFILQLSINSVTRSDSVTDGASRINGIDPTPPVYGDGQ
jgi:hypothetical protein